MGEISEAERTSSVAPQVLAIESLSCSVQNSISFFLSHSKLFELLIVVKIQLIHLMCAICGN